MITLYKNENLFKTPLGIGISLNGPASYFDSECIIESPVRLGGGYFNVKKIGAYSYISRGAVVKGVGAIGRFCSIATNLSIGYGNHNTQFVSTHPMFENVDLRWNENFHNLKKNYGKWLEEMGNISKNMMKERNSSPVIGNDVWIGTGVFISRNVKIGDGAVIGAHSVVTKDVPPYAIVAGVPARVIRFRFNEYAIKKLCLLKWWDYGPNILANIDLRDADSAINQIEERIESGFPKLDAYKFVLHGGTDNTVDRAW